MKKYFFTFAIIFVALLFAVYTSKPSSYKTEKLVIGNTVFSALVADTETLHAQGLSNRKMLSDREAMLFVFEKPNFYGFWMKDMLFSIDIVWLDENGVVVSIEKNVLPESYPKVFTPSKPAKYVVEFNQGTVDSVSIKIGDKITFSGGK